MKLLLILFLWTVTRATNTSVQYGFQTTPDRVIYADDDRVRGFRGDTDKDIIIGGLFAVHSAATGSAGGRCSNNPIRSGAERTEAFLYALDLVNSDPSLLPNIRLGFDVRDTCVSENIALDEMVDLLFVTSNSETCTEMFSSESNDSLAVQQPVVGIIGPTSSQVSLSVASFSRLFNKPTVSYSVSSPTFDNRDRYGYFYRTHPSDNQEVQAMIDLAIMYNWTYVTIIHSNNAYGEPAIDIFRKLAEENGICIDLDIGLDDNYKKADYVQVATKLVDESEAEVVVFFASLSYVEQFMEQLSLIRKANNGDERNFLWIASTAWAQASSIRDKYPDIIAGLLTFSARTNTQSDFIDYFSQLTLNSNNRNPWFREYYEQYFNCTKGISCDNSTPVTDHPNYIQRSYIQRVLDAVYSVAHALNDFLNDNCDQPIVWDSTLQMCVGQSKQLNGSELRNYLQNVNFTSPSGNRIVFDALGSIDGQYSLVNFQHNGDKYEFVTTGVWTSDGQPRLILYENASLQFGINSMGEPILDHIDSQCRSCPVGHIRVPVQSSCCGTCAQCNGRNFTSSLNAKECDMCLDSTWGNNPLTGSNDCKDIPERYLDPTDPFGILLILVAVFGLICVTLVCIAVGIYWKNTVIKSSGREQMTLLLIGIALSFIVTTFFLVRPSITICLLQRLGTWFCFSLILSALFIKLVRITRIFLNNKTKTLWCIEWSYQILFTFLLVAIQMVLVVFSLVVVYPEAEESIVLNSENTLDTPIVQIQCAPPHIAVLSLQIIFYSALLIATNILAILTIKFPENFNEARYVAFATFSIFLIWIGFLQTYFAVDSRFQLAVICFAIQSTSLAVLFCLFAPRIFIVIFYPLMNKTSSPHSSSIPVSSIPRHSSSGLVPVSSIPRHSSSGLVPVSSIPRHSSAGLVRTSGVPGIYQMKEYDMKCEVSGENGLHH